MRGSFRMFPVCCTVTMPCTSLLGWPGIGSPMATVEASRKPACETRHENGPHFAGHSGARPASPETMNTSLEDRVHEPVFMASGPGPHGPSRNDDLPLKRQCFSPLLSLQAKKIIKCEAPHTRPVPLAAWFRPPQAFAPTLICHGGRSCRA